MRKPKARSLMRQIELRFNERMETLLPRLFEEHKTAASVCRELGGVNPKTLKEWLGLIGRKMDTTTRLVDKETA